MRYRTVYRPPQENLNEETALLITALAASLLLALALFGCAMKDDTTPQQAAQSAAATPSPTADPTQEPTPTPKPTPTVVTIGAIGDIMIMPAQINGAYDEATDTYDFSRSFLGVKNQFRSVDLMCGNLETTLSGEEAGYSKKKRSNEPADTFNAPDVVVDNLQGRRIRFSEHGQQPRA